MVTCKFIGLTAEQLELGTKYSICNFDLPNFFSVHYPTKHATIGQNETSMTLMLTPPIPCLFWSIMSYLPAQIPFDYIIQADWFWCWHHATKLLATLRPELTWPPRQMIHWNASIHMKNNTDWSFQFTISYHWLTLKTKSCHDANFVVIDDKVGIMTTLGVQWLINDARTWGQGVKSIRAD